MQAHYSNRYRWLVTAVIALGTVGAVVLSTSFNVAVPALMKRFGIDSDQVQLAVTSFMLASTIAMLPTPWLLRRFGLRRCFLGAVALLILSSIFGSISVNFEMLIIARTAQGVAAGIIYPLGTFIVMWLFPPDQQGKASGLLGFSIVLAPAIAPVLGGLLIDHLGWESVFFISLPFCLLAWISGLFLLPEPDPSPASQFDWIGMTLLSIVTVSLLGFITHLQDSASGDSIAIIELILAISASLYFLRHAARNHRAIISIHLFTIKTSFIGMFISFIYGFGIYGSTYLIPLYLQTVSGLSATEAGAVLVPGGIGLALSLPLAGILSDRSSPRLVVFGGLFLIAASFGGMTWIAMQNSHRYFVELTLISRIGSGLIIASLNQASIRNLPGHLLGQAAMFIGYVRQLGGMLGVACLAVFVSWRSVSVGNDPASIYRSFAEGFLLSLLIFMAAMVAAGFMNQPKKTLPSAV